MSRVVISALMGAFAVGVIVGAIGWGRYSEHRFGLKMLNYLRDDSAQQIRNYQKLNELIAASDQERVRTYIERQIEMERLVMQSAEASIGKSR